MAGEYIATEIKRQRKKRCMEEKMQGGLAPTRLKRAAPEKYFLDS
jgi:hypothetical protein